MVVTDVSAHPIPVGPRTIAELTRTYEDPDAVALLDDNVSYNYRELDLALNAVCQTYLDHGLVPGDRVAAAAYRATDLMLAFLASQRLQLVWVGINPALAGPEFTYLLADSGARLLLTDTQTLERNSAALDEASVMICVLDDDAATGWPAMVHARASAPDPKIEIDPYAAAAISYTSGTTSAPKGAIHTQHSILSFPAAGLDEGRGGHWLPQLRRTATVPLTILNAMVFGPLLALAGGGTYVSVDRRDAVGISEAIRRHGIETINTVGTTMYDLLTREDIPPESLNSLRYAAAGGSPITDELKDMFRKRFGNELVEDYGLTESPCSLSATKSFDPPAATGGVGRPFQHIEVAALGADDEPLSVGKTGELSARSVQSGAWAGVYTGMIGYWNQPEETERVLKNGWLHTGDIGFVDSDGVVHVVGRKNATIMRGGASIYPGEIEAVIMRHPQVDGVVVVGRPDPRLGEVPIAYLQIDPDFTPDREGIFEAELVAHCMQHLANYKVPVSWMVVEEIPRNAMLKVDRRRLGKTPAVALSEL